MCGTEGKFARDRLSISESYRCDACGGHLRYQGQARAILHVFSRHGARSIAELVAEPGFRRIDILEPGTKGPLRSLLRPLDGYVQSAYEPTLPRGEVVDGVRCEDLMALTFPSECFDLVLTSDVFEHVRHPRIGFAEVFRVLRPGGAHVFTIPGRWPLAPRTIARVDVSGEEDVHLLQPTYHNREHLVYNDFGRDLLDLLDEVGFVTEPMLFASGSPTTSMQATFCSVRPLEPIDEPDDDVTAVEAHTPPDGRLVRIRRRLTRRS